MRKKGGTMKKFLVLIPLIALFIACDYASEAVKLKPDIEITWIDPLATTTFDGDSTSYFTIAEIHFVAKNSVDCYLTKMLWEYYDENDYLFYGPDEIPLYAKIEGIVDPSEVDTFIILNIPVFLEPVRDELNEGQSAKVLLRFVAVDEYSETEYDTCDTWFGVYMVDSL
jgi:hypothetical protein